MNSKIIASLNKQKKLKLMTHVVAGYPDMNTSIQLVKTMYEHNVDFVEIQIPFSDPLADGPTIMSANQASLDNGTTIADCFEMANELTELPIPILFMSYFNIPYVYGINNFLNKSKENGISGIILPDIPYDEPEGSIFNEIDKIGLSPIVVISPDINEHRLKELSYLGKGFIYTTLKTGVTGAKTDISSKGIEFLNKIKKNSSLPIAAGFGISTPEHLLSLKGKADIAVIGSHIINLFNDGGIESVKSFLNECNDICK